MSDAFDFRETDYYAAEMGADLKKQFWAFHPIDPGRLALGYLGWGELLVGLYAGFLLGGVGGGLLSVLRVVERKAFPFGPFMIVGALVGVVAGDLLLESLVTG